MEPTQSSETSAFNTQTPEKYPEDNLSLLHHVFFMVLRLCFQTVPCYNVTRNISPKLKRKAAWNWQLTSVKITNLRISGTIHPKTHMPLGRAEISLCFQFLKHFFCVWRRVNWYKVTNVMYMPVVHFRICNRGVSSSGSHCGSPKGIIQALIILVTWRSSLFPQTIWMASASI
jgi:hypothetical protein